VDVVGLLRIQVGVRSMRATVAYNGISLWANVRSRRMIAADFQRPRIGLAGPASTKKPTGSEWVCMKQAQDQSLKSDS
jgi:hypothetical protein